MNGLSLFFSHSFVANARHWMDGCWLSCACDTFAGCVFPCWTETSAWAKTSNASEYYNTKYEWHIWRAPEKTRLGAHPFSFHIHTYKSHIIHPCCCCPCSLRLHIGVLRSVAASPWLELIIRLSKCLVRDIIRLVRVPQEEEYAAGEFKSNTPFGVQTIIIKSKTILASVLCYEMTFFLSTFHYSFGDHGSPTDETVFHTSRSRLGDIW